MARHPTINFSKDMRQQIFLHLSMQLLTVKQGTQFAYYNPPIPSSYPKNHQQGNRQSQPLLL
jgi:hypothetical protein